MGSKRTRIVFGIGAGVLLLAGIVHVVVADVFVRPPPDVDLVGELRFVQASKEDTLADIARANDLGHVEMRLANPELEFWLPGEGAKVVVPGRFILPDAPRDGLVLNLPEMRIYYYPRKLQDGQQVVMTHPVSVGRMDWRTPLGTTKVATKQKNPSWR